MRNIKFSAIAIAMFVTLFSCQKEELSSVEKTQILTAYAPGESSETKVSFEEDATTIGKLNLSWKVNDVITVYNDPVIEPNVDPDIVPVIDPNVDPDNAIVYNKIGNWIVSKVDENSGMATFEKLTGDDLVEGGKYIAVYPASEKETLSDRDSETDYLNQTQSADNDLTHLDDNCRMRTPSFLFGTNISFNHEMAILSIAFKRETAPNKLTVDDGGNIYNVTLNGFKANETQTAHLMIKPNNVNRSVKASIDNELVYEKPTTKPFRAGTRYSWGDVSDTSLNYNFTYITLDDGTAMINGLVGGEEAAGEKNLSFPETVTIDGRSYIVNTIHDGAFDGHKFTGSLTIPNNITDIRQGAFQLSTFTGPLTIPAGTKVGNSAFKGCSFSSLTISEGVTTIETAAFYECKNLKGTLTIPSTVTTINYLSFSDCTGLTSLVITEGVTTIGSSAFLGCTGLTSLSIPEGVTTIVHNAFKDCTGLEGTLTIPSSVEELGARSFFGCDNLESIVLKWEGDEIPQRTEDNIFPEKFEIGKGDSSIDIITIPKNSKSSYRLKGWDKYKMIEIE